MTLYHEQHVSSELRHIYTSIGTSAPTTTLPAATLAAATTTRMAPMARTRPPRP